MSVYDLARCCQLYDHSMRNDAFIANLHFNINCIWYLILQQSFIYEIGRKGCRSGNLVRDRSLNTHKDI